jgi:CHAD domain-containing protein
MRAAIDMFAEVLPVRAGRLNAELGWLAALLGDVRDLDIQLGRFDDWTENMPGDHREALDELADLLIGERGRARAELLAALDSKRYERLVTGLTTMLLQGPSIRSSAGRALSVTAVPALIGERHDASRKAARRAKRTGVASDYHRLRIRCKRLRYSLEFASGLYGGELKAFVRQMTRLQDTLGAMQDAEVASARLQAIALTEEGAGLSRSTIFAMGGVAGRYHSEAERLLAELPALVDLLEGKQWARTRSVLTQRRKQAFSDAMASAATARPPRIAIAGRARPAIAKLPSGLVGASRPAPPGRAQPESEPTAPDQAVAADELKDPQDEVEASPPAPPPGGRVATTITPIRRQVAPS